MDKYFKEINEILGGSITEDIIDFGDNQSISLAEIEQEYLVYKSIEDEIDEYIEENDLDDLADYDTITSHFSKYESYFSFPQAVLIDFVKFVVKRIYKK